MAVSRVGSLLGWLGLVGLTAWLLADREAHRVGEGEVWLAYPATGPVSLALSGGRDVRLLLWLEQPTRWATDARATDDVQLGWRAVDPQGREIASGEPWTRFRASWGLPLEGEDPLIPVSTGPRAGFDLSDPRLVELAAPLGATRLEITARFVPEGARLLVVGFEEDERDTVEQVRTVVGTDVERAERAAARLGPWSWEELPLDWRERLARHVWRRLASVDQDLRPVRVTSGHDWLPFDDAAALAVPVPAGGATAYNLEGEVTFEAHWTGPDGREPRATRTWLEIVGEGMGEVQDLGRVDRIGPLSFPAGVREVRVARDPHDLDGAVLLRATTRASTRDRAWGDPPRIELGPGPDGLQRVAPDLTGLIYWRVDVGQPLQFAIPGDHEVRLLVRPRLGPGSLPALGPAEPERSRSLTVLRNARRTWAESLSVPARASAYERYTQGDDPSTARVSEETEWFLASVPEESVLTLSAEEPIDVQVFVKEPFAPSDVPEPGYPLDQLSDLVRARYLPFARRTWRARYPSGREHITRQGRSIRIDAQVRWVYRATGGPSGLRYRVVELPPPFDLVAEPLAGGGRTRLDARPQTLQVPVTGRILVDHRVTPDRVGDTVTFRFEGREEVREILSSSGTFRFERLPPGPVQVAVDEPGVFLANVTGERPWTVRRVWRLDPGRQRRIPIPAGGEGLSVHVARREAESQGALVWRLVGAGVDVLPVSRERREGRIRLQSVEGRAEVMSRLESPWVWSRPLRLWLGGRLEGEAVLELSLAERSAPVWIWVSSTWGGPTERTDERHWAIPGVGP